MTIRRIRPAVVMQISCAKTCFLTTLCCAVALFLAETLAFAQSAGKIPREVIDQAAAQGTVMVLVGLDVPWQMESRLNADEVRTHVHKDLGFGEADRVEHAHRMGWRGLVSRPSRSRTSVLAGTA